MAEGGWQRGEGCGMSKGGQKAKKMAKNKEITVTQKKNENGYQRKKKFQQTLPGKRFYG